MKNLEIGRYTLVNKKLGIIQGLFPSTAIIYVYKDQKTVSINRDLVFMLPKDFIPYNQELSEQITNDGQEEIRKIESKQFDLFLDKEIESCTCKKPIPDMSKPFNNNLNFCIICDK